MGMFDILSHSSAKPEPTAVTAEENHISEPASFSESSIQPADTSSHPTSVEDTSNLEPLSPKDINSPASPPIPLSSPQIVASSQTTVEALVPDAKGPALQIRRFSFKTFSFVHEHEGHKHELSTVQDHEKKAHAAAAFSKRLARPLTSNSDRRARDSALIVRSLIVGPSSSPISPKVTRATAKPQLSKVKSQLMQPKSANKLIAQLRALPVTDELADTSVGKGVAVDGQTRGLIHAVCLDHTDAEEHSRHFSQLADVTVRAEEDQFIAQSICLPSVANASIEKLTDMFNDMHLVNLVQSPDLGFGQPGDGEGLLAGAVPTAETVLNGIEQITPQLMALGFATGRAMIPDHKGIYPPTDRMSVLTYWWGLELALPPPSLAYLSNAQSISAAIMNFLSALALINNGVREILPFIRYIAQFIDFEFSSIKQQNRGHGVVCAATWIMPAAMVPRPWDFPTRPNTPVARSGTTPDVSPGQTPIPSSIQNILPSTEPVRPVPLPDVVITSPTASAESVPSEAVTPVLVSAQ